MGTAVIKGCQCCPHCHPVNPLTWFPPTLHHITSCYPDIWMMPALVLTALSASLLTSVGVSPTLSPRMVSFRMEKTQRLFLAQGWDAH